MSDFPIHWDNPEDALLHWTRDTVHEPRPSLPLRRSFSRDIIGAGASRAVQVYPFPGQSRSILVNGYTFETQIPDPPQVMSQKLKALEARMQADVPDLPRRWREEFEPELARDLAAWQAFDLQAASWDGLVQHFDQMLEREQRHVDLIAHLQQISPVDKDHGAIGKHDRGAGRAGEAGEPGEALLARRHVFVLVAVGARHDEAGQAAPRELRAQRRHARCAGAALGSLFE